LKVPRLPKILHVVEHEKFIPPFIDLINRKLDPTDHHFFFYAKGELYQGCGKAKITRNSDFSTRLISFIALAKHLNSAEKIVLHGLFGSAVIFLLFLQPWLLKKCYWVIWGGDLYTHSLDKRTFRWLVKEIFKRPVIKRLGHLVTYVAGDIELARRWYGARGQHHECLGYPSNTFRPTELPAEHHLGLHILVGNSADPSNEHREVLRLLKDNEKGPTKVFVPLSYGNADYAKTVVEQGRRLFGERFVPLLEFMPYDHYLQILADIDIAIFNHRRQQGMGNIIALLGMGKTVCVRSDTTSWQTLTRMGIQLGDSLKPDLCILTEEDAARNRSIVTQRFSEDVLVNQLRAILEH
jgi:dTDP-N-acetylfucosamine:lipid II N-acetylfucosaminyltransferase